MRVLLSHWPNLALRSVDGKTALQCTIRFHFCQGEHVALQLILAGATLDCIDRGGLCTLAATSAFATLMERGVVVRDLRDDSGQTPLHWAVRVHQNAADLVSMLIDCGVDLEARTCDERRNTCVDLAASHHRDSALCLLVRAAHKSTSQTHLVKLRCTSLSSCKIIHSLVRCCF
jgi:hypothetical protein